MGETVDLGQFLVPDLRAARILSDWIPDVPVLLHRSKPGWGAHTSLVAWRESHGNELFLTLCIFIVMALALYWLGRLFVPQVVRQGKSLVTHMKTLSATQVQNAILAKTVGAWEFNHEFGTSSDPRYLKALKEFEANGRSGEGLYQAFPQLHSRLQSEFEANYEKAQVLHLNSEGTKGIPGAMPLEQWFMQVKAPELYSDKGAYYLAQWEAEYASPEKADLLAKMRQQPNFESQRDEEIRRRMWTDIQSDAVLLAQLKMEWSKTVAMRTWDAFRKSSAYQSEFKTFYEGQELVAPQSVPVDYAFYQTLATAYPKGKQAFMQAVRQHYDQEQQSEAHQQFDFEAAKKLEFGQKWWASSQVADWVRDHAANEGPKAMEAIVGWFDKRLGDLFRVPIQIGTAMLLAFFILIEWQGVKSGTAGLRNTRLQPIYDEIAPGVIALGKLIGKSFQGQMIISAINASLTLFAMWLIGVEYKFVLALMVFLFSFIPVVGVLLSGIPICTIAILQPGGSLMMVLQVVIAIGIIHLIESMFLSPRILGKIGDLHPVLVIVILLVAEKFFGMWGLVLGVPVAIYIIRVVILNSPIPGIYTPVGTSGTTNLAAHHE